MGKKVEYTNGELTIVWQPEMCQHAGICVKMLPNVYHPKERPWVQIENATTEELIAQISKCPSGALSYRLNNGGLFHSLFTAYQYAKMLQIVTVHVKTKSGQIW